jgi:DNA-binding LacI/PurR family transcriptional regulator
MKKTARIMTLGDIAHQCGVSPSTVSRVLNNAPGISSAARNRILEVARQHNFILQKQRRPLARTQLKLMIVIPEESAITMNPFFDITELLNAINNAFAQDWKQIEAISFSHFLYVSNNHYKGCSGSGNICALRARPASAISDTA